MQRVSRTAKAELSDAVRRRDEYGPLPERIPAKREPLVFSVYNPFPNIAIQKRKHVVSFMEMLLNFRFLVRIALQIE